jgi:hypothetical protein
MEQFINWRSIKIILITLLINSCALAQKDDVVRSGYYFVIQITNVSGDTITFETIEIYRTLPNIEITLFNDTTSHENAVTTKFRNRTFNTGILKGVKNRYIGKLLVLNSTIDEIEKTGMVHFKIPKKTKQIRLGKMYRIK